MRKLTIALMTIAAVALLAGTASSAAMINMNFLRNATTNPTVTNPGYGLWGQGTETWNLSASFTGSDLVDSSGTATTVGYGIGNRSGNNSNADFGPDDLTFQGFYGQDITVTISGLNPSTSYEMLVYHAANNANEVETANGVSPSDFTGLTTTTGGATYIDAFGDPDALGTHFWYYSSVAADASGDILVSSTGGGWETATGFQIVAIPEPASLSLLMLVGGACFIIRRRFRR